MKTITKSPYFWALFAAASCTAAFLSYHYFPRAFPIIHLNIQMDRSEAVKQAQQITNEFKLGPNNARHATAFITDDPVKTFIELEAGGKEEVVAIMEQNLYQIYTWQVRQFKPFEQNEVTVRFTPEGTPYGFQEKISENESGTNVGESKAQNVATSFAQAAPWNIDFEQYKLVEASQEKKASGRIDHTIMYERKDEKIGEGFYRLKIVVSGDNVSELTHSVKVPDAFIRRYQEMRSANETIAHAANLIMMLLYMLGGLLIGLLFLFRKRWVIWRPAFSWALLIALLSSATIVNKLPLYWMGYNTALSPYAFIMQLVIMIISSFIFSTILFSAVFMGAESLTRRAFGNQLQLWHVFQPSVASSYTILGYTISAYLLVPFSLAYVVLFYLFTSHYLNWWTPSSALFDPNILASYFPWLDSIAISLQAGFYEECLFRAVPLASAALLGNRYGKRNWWIAGAFILQAIVFGAAHANYPAQPAYARLVELLVFSSVFGAIYLKFGLLIAATSHFAYDVFWFALPLFISTASYAWINKIAVIALAGIPLWIVGISRIKMGAWLTIPASLYNRAWRPAREKEITQEKQKPQEQNNSFIHARTLYAFVIAGIIGLVGWAVTTRFRADTPSFTVGRASVAHIAPQTLQEKQIDLKKWYQMVYAITQLERYPDPIKRHRFIWQKGGKELYREFINSYLSPQLFVARFVTWEGTVTERSEEHHLYFMPNGSFRRYTHKVPEATPGASLSKKGAKEKALAMIAQQFNRTKDQLKEVSAVATKQPERLDWKVTYASTTDYPLDEGEARLEVSIAGDEVVGAYQYIHVPEKWERAYENKQAFSTIINMLCMLIIYILFLACAFLSFTRWKIHTTQALIFNFVGLSIILLFGLFNYWPSVIAMFNTSQPFTDQLFRIFSISTVMTVLQAALLAVMISLVTQVRSIYRALPSSMATAIGISLGAVTAGSLAVITWLIPSLSPTWANFMPLGFAFPGISDISSQLVLYITTTINLMLFIAISDLATSHWKRLRFVGVGIFFVAGFVRAGLINSYNIPLLIATGLLVSLILVCGYLFAIRFDYSIVPIATGTYAILQLMQQLIFNAYPYAIIANIASILLITGVSWYWHTQMRKNSCYTA